MDCTTIARKFLSLLLPLIITHHWPRFANLLSSRIGKGRFKIALGIRSKRRLDFLGRKGEESDLIETTIALDNSTRDFPDPTILASIKESRDNGAWREILLFSGMIERIRREALSRPSSSSSSSSSTAIVNFHRLLFYFACQASPINITIHQIRGIVTLYIGLARGICLGGTSMVNVSFRNRISRVFRIEPFVGEYTCRRIGDFCLATWCRVLFIYRAEQDRSLFTIYFAKIKIYLHR